MAGEITPTGSRGRLTFADDERLPSSAGSKWLRWAIWISLAGLAFALVRQAFSDSYPFDLSYFLVAGRVWSSGGDPYGPAFRIAAEGLIAPEAALWAYPPQWWGTTVALASLETDLAVDLWKGIKLVLLGSGFLVFVEALAARDESRGSKLPIIGAATLLLVADATRISLHLGQTSEIVFWGMAVLLCGAATGRTWMQALGMTVLCLKPQFGIFFILLSLTTAPLRRAAFTALAVSAAACLPILWQQGLSGTLSSTGQWLQNLGRYGTLDWNRPVELTGLTHAAALVGAPTPSPLQCLAVGVALMLWTRSRAGCALGSLTLPRHCLVGLAILSATMPLHAYDLVYLPMFILVLPLLRPWAAGAVVLGNLLIWRTSSLAFGTYLYERSASFDGALVGSIVQASAATAATSLVLVAMLWGWKSTNAYRCCDSRASEASCCTATAQGTWSGHESTQQ